MSPCGWMVTAVDSEIHDLRDYLRTEYGGLTLHIRPCHNDEIGAISVFLEDIHEPHGAQLVINRFLSAMAWKESSPFVTLGAAISGAKATDRNRPRFNWREERILRGGIISTLDFEHLQNPSGNKQKLALALYRDGLNSNNEFYRFLSFYKIVNIGYERGPQQAAWINANLNNVWGHTAQLRLQELQKTEPDVGAYLLKQGRNAIAHAFSQPILDPDLPTDRAEARSNTYLMEGLSQTFIQEELGVPSLRKIWDQHFYELEGFKRLFGDVLVHKLKAKESVPPGDFPAIPALTLNLKEHQPYECFSTVPFRVAECRGGIVLLKADPNTQPMHVILNLDFPSEQLELVISALGIDPLGAGYTRDLAISFYEFLIGYFGNGCLQVFDSTSGLRLSHKLPFIPLNVDPRTAIERWQQEIQKLSA
jgi:hypothetical protein